MNNEIKILDVVALLEDLPEEGVYRGQVGTVVELLAPKVFEVEFSENSEDTYAMLTLKAEHLMILHYEPVKVA